MGKRWAERAAKSLHGWRGSAAYDGSVLRVLLVAAGGSQAPGGVSQISHSAMGVAAGSCWGAAMAAIGVVAAAVEALGPGAHSGAGGGDLASTDPVPRAGSAGVVGLWAWAWAAVGW